MGGSWCVRVRVGTSSVRAVAGIANPRNKRRAYECCKMQCNACIIVLPSVVSLLPFRTPHRTLVVPFRSQFACYRCGSHECVCHCLYFCPFLEYAFAPPPSCRPCRARRQAGRHDTLPGDAPARAHSNSTSCAHAPPRPVSRPLSLGTDRRFSPPSFTIG